MWVTPWRHAAHGSAGARSHLERQSAQRVVERRSPYHRVSISIRLTAGKRLGFDCPNIQRGRQILYDRVHERLHSLRKHTATGGLPPLCTAPTNDQPQTLFLYAAPHRIGTALLEAVSVTRLIALLICSAVIAHVSPSASRNSSANSSSWSEIRSSCVSATHGQHRRTDPGPHGFGSRYNSPATRTSVSRASSTAVMVSSSSAASATGTRTTPRPSSPSQVTYAAVMRQSSGLRLAGATNKACIPQDWPG